MIAKSQHTHPGIYAIICVPNNVTYVGQALNIQERWTRHRWELARKRHHNAYLQNAWAKYGPEAFKFIVLADMTGLDGDDLRAALSTAEVEALAALKDSFNLTAAGSNGMIATPELRAKLSEARIQMWADPAYKDRVRATMLAVAADPEFQARRGTAISEAMSNPEYREQRSRLSRAMWTDEDFRRARSKERRKHWANKEYREGQSASRAATWTNPDVRGKRQAGLRASWIDPEVRAARLAGMAQARAENRVKPSPIEDAILAILTERTLELFTASDMWREAERRLGIDVSRAAPSYALKRLVARGLAVREGNLYRKA